MFRTIRKASCFSLFAIAGAFGGSLALTASSVSFAADTESTPVQNLRLSDFAAGKAAVEARDWKRAAKHFANVVSQEPRNADAHSMLGFSLRWMDRYEEAFAAYDKALSLDPNHKGALHYSGIAYLKTQQRDKAVANLQRLQNLCASCDETKQLAAAISQPIALK